MSGSRTEFVLASEDLVETNPRRPIGFDLGKEGDDLVLGVEPTTVPGD